MSYVLMALAPLQLVAEFAAGGFEFGQATMQAAGSGVGSQHGLANLMSLAGSLAGETTDALELEGPWEARSRLC